LAQVCSQNANKRFFADLYVFNQWQPNFAIDNTFPIKGFLYALVPWAKNTRPIALADTGVRHFLSDVRVSA
jgi:hypothetical protein